MTARRSLLAAILVASAAAAPAFAATRYDVPAQPLEQALLRIGIASGRQILFSPEVASGLTSRPLHGELDLNDALARVLPPELEAVSRGGLVIVRRRAPGEGHTRNGEAEEPAPAAPTNLDTLVVTALKHESLLQRTPLSISVVQGEIADRGGVSLNDLDRFVPGLQFNSNGVNLQRIAIRGVRGVGDATTGLYYDETPVTGPVGSASDPGSTQPDLSLFDVARVEVLRGPQGTLYGAGSMGGTVRVIFNKPDPSALDGRVEVRAEAVEHGSPSGSLRLVANLPLVRDRLAVRIAAYGDDVGGYIDNGRFGGEDINRETTRGLRAAASFTPSGFSTLTLSVARQRNRMDNAVNYWFPALGRYNTRTTIIPAFASDVDLVGLVYRWEGEWATITASASGYRWNTRYVSDYTATLTRSAAAPEACTRYFSLDAPCGPAQAAAFADYAASRMPGAWSQTAKLASDIQELRANSTANSAFTWTVGIFREDRRDDFDSTVYRADQATGAVIDGEIPTGSRIVENRVVQTAAYGEASLRGGRGLTLTLGARGYSYDRTVGGEVFVANRITGSDVTPFRAVNADASGVVTKVALSVEPLPRVLLHVTRAEGFRPGGGNNVPGAGAEAPESYDPDSLVSYEFGSKIGLWDGALTLNSAIYQIDWSNMQVSAASPNGAWRFNTNAGAARIRGGEAELVAKPRPGLSVVAAAGFTDAVLVDDQRNVIGIGVGEAGDRLPFTPRWTGALSVVGQKRLRDLVATARADLTYAAGAGSDFREDLPTYQRQPPSSLLDLQFSLDGDRLGATLRLTNVLNVRAPELITANLGGIGRQTYSARPRAIALVVRRAF